MQILGILRLFALDQSSGICNHLIQINTGEGKSIALGFTAVILAALGFSVDVVCYSRYLCERDEKEFAALFELLDQQAYISYNDFNMLSSKIMQNGVHLPDIRSTFRSFLQSKSREHTRAAAGDYDLYALLGLSTTASQNDIKQAYTRKCKEYHPDKNNGDQAKTELFKQIFNARKVWKEPEGAESSGARKNKTGGGGQVRRSVLLVDEVDVFFGEEFYGNSYRPCIDLDDGYADDFKLLLFVWESRDSFPRTSVQKLMAREEVAGLRKTFPNLSEAMLKRELLKMLEAVKRFPKGFAPKLRGGENEYKILREEKRKKPICYTDPASGVPCDSITYGYVPNIFRTCGVHLVSHSTHKKCIPN
jgi:hypothetical protein